MIPPVVCNLYKHPGWETDPECLYIGRAGHGRSGDLGNPTTVPPGGQPGDTLPAFEAYARKRLSKDPQFRQAIIDMTGKKLMCFCKPKPCHGDIYVKLWDELTLPSRDGIDHVNVYSQGRTELGRMLSNFDYSPIQTEDGLFNSVEGYWYWLSVDPAHPRRELLRKKWGAAAKTLGRELRGEDWPDGGAVFRRKIRAAIWAKIEANPNLQAEVKASILPYRHYYVYHGKVVEPEGGRWLLQFFERCAEHLRK